MQEGKYVVLCIDDDLDVLTYLRTVLQANGYIAVTAESAEDGRRKFKESSPDLMIVDLMMEEVDSGTDFVRTVKAAGNTAPIYMLSSAGDSLSSTTDSSELGLTGVFQKPLNPDALLSILRAKLK